MKKTIAYLFAALAIVTAASCTKVEQQIDGEEAGSGKVITCTFAANENATKTTTTDGKTPLWAAGDKIMLYDGTSSYQKLTLASSGTPSSTVGVIDGTSATFTFVRPSGWTNVYAIYPYSACVSSFSASAPKINFAGQDGTFAKANICAGKEDAGTISFKNVGAILKFTNKPAKVMNILVPVAGMANDYSVTFSDVTPTLNIVTASHITEVDLGNGTDAVYIGVPAGEIASGSVFKYRTPSRGVLGTKTTATDNTIDKNKVYSLGAITDSDITAPSDLSFSVSATKKVYFSKGNLQYQASTGTWQFAANQYDIIGNAAGNNTTDATARSTQSAWIDLFGWGATGQNINGQQPYSISTTNSDYKTVETAGGSETLTIANKADWGYCMGGESSVWRTMSGGSGGEWKYLLSTRTVNGSTGEGKSYRRATINSDATGVYGMIIYPDGYTSQTTATSYTSSDWATMESAGCVFLPAAGYRYGSDVSGVGYNGYYWSSTADGSSNAYYLYFDGSYVFPADHNNRSYGYSVRLVSVAQ